MGTATAGETNTSSIMGSFNPPMGQYQLSRRKENDNHKAKININESATIRMPRLNELGIEITSMKRKAILFFILQVIYLKLKGFQFVLLSKRTFVLEKATAQAHFQQTANISID